MTNKLFQVLGIAGLKESGPADAFTDLPVSDPGYRPAGGAPDVREAPDARDVRAVPDVLDALHQEFRQVLADPWQLVGRADWSAAPARARWQAPDATLAASATVAGRLLDMVLPQESLDGFIARFVASLDHTEDPTLLLETRPEEVLQLFAPVLTGARHAPLPLTTRRDHHAMSPDSAVLIGRFAAAAGLSPAPVSPIPLSLPTAFRQDNTP